ncbi:hypothetical protein MAR_031970, partial [Mya arenaria]
SKCNDDGECLNGCSDGYTGVKCDTDINNVYEDIDDVTGDPSHNQEYEMTQTSTEGVERRSCQYSNTTLRQCY